MIEWLSSLPHKLCTRRCRDLNCQIGQGYHSHHLTAIGHWRHIWRFR